MQAFVAKGNLPTFSEIMAKMRTFFQDELLKLLCWFHTVYGINIVDHLYFILIFLTSPL